MPTNGLRKTIDRLRQTLAPNELTDEQLPISSSVTNLMKAGVKAMFIAKLKSALAVVAVMAVLGAGGGVYSGGESLRRIMAELSPDRYNSAQCLTGGSECPYSTTLSHP
jgi:hypothetical protein